jgi:hypothetical protein
MKHQDTDPQGVYAGLAPAILKLVARGPTLKAKLKTAMATGSVSRTSDATRAGASDNPNSFKT